MRLRDIITIVESAAAYAYVGNCISSHTAPYLADMMDQATPVSYQTIMRAVGRAQLAECFPDFDWSSRPRALTMARDPYVSYYRSTFNGKPCYYVRESGIEYIFADMDFEERQPTKATKTLSVTEDGRVVPVGNGRAIFHINHEGRTAEIAQSTAKTPASSVALIEWLMNNQIETVIEDGEQVDVYDFVEWLRS